MKNKEKATIVVSIAEVTAGKTSSVPFTAALNGPSPFSNLWYIFSAITASVDGDVKFVSAEKKSNFGRVEVL